ncbi:putative cytochrome C biogenesis protein CcdA [Actinocatenispora thailandica]|uniref:Putative cytochrome C biogenesis protein CcdA n=1 Tax=Actinocatenispora thailandica TaxID=227318 RepID=A0A7R7HZE4_9ACTN|nr:cytochrome c biogenesis protein CcdA [Actinocatenispora thailandica]BCJ38163.1 putative cytochrome C biogenesis protein CcdA [Actinocatenispora thailandica]
MGASFAHVAASGPLLLALAVSLVAGLVSFLSPCVLPLVPGYLSYVTGLAGADLDAALGTDPHGRAVSAADGDAAPAGGVAVTTRTQARTRARVRGRILAGGLLFVAGFTVVFVLSGVVVASLGGALLEHRVAVERVIGALVIVLGLAFLGVIPGMQREARVHRVPAAGLVGAPVLGAVFALGWTPCVGPTLGAVLSLAAVQGSVGRGVLLAVAYCLGLGIPFLAFGLGFRRLLQVFGVIRRHSVWVTRIGGVLLILVGVALLTGAWDAFTIWLQAEVGAGKVNV